MRRPLRFLGAAALLAPACSPTAPAVRSTTGPVVAAPPQEPTTEATTTSTEPPTTAPSTTVTVTIAAEPVTTTRPRPAPATTVTTFVMPEAADDKGDVEWLVRQTFPEDPERAVRIARRESGLRPGADENPPYIGVMQIDSRLHAALIRSLGYTTADMYHAGPNLAVARRLFELAGWSPWA